LSPIPFFVIFYLSLFIATLIEAFRFSTIVMHIYYSNIKHAAEEVQKKEDTEQKLMELLVRIEAKMVGTTDPPAPDSKEYMESLRKKLDENMKDESKQGKN
ncbi:hypothetical protein, partial [Mesobacillus campisalis]